MKLKRYQENAIEKLEEFMLLSKKPNITPDLAFHKLTEEKYNKRYDDVPFVCIKIPTGGGKTLVGCKAIERIMAVALQHKMDTGVVMWFVPSDAIKTQTLKKFKDSKDWHYEMLNESFDTKFKVFFPTKKH